MTRTGIAKPLLIFAALAMCAVPVFAQKQTPPAGGPPKPFLLPEHETYTLRNGVKVTLVPYGNVPKVTVDLAVRAGRLNEPADMSGLADLMGNLMQQGTTSRSAKQVADQAADMGGAIDIRVGFDQSTISSDVLSEFGPRTVALIADVAEHPSFPESELPRLKNDALRELAVDHTIPQKIADARLNKILYGDHPYGQILATREGIERTTIATIRKYYVENFGAMRAHLYVAGRFDSAAMKSAIATAFGGWASGPAPLINVPDAKPQHLLDVTDRPGAAQSTLYVALPVPPPNSPDAIRLAVMNSLLGGAFDSRITSNIREQKGYTYSPFSQIASHYHTSFWVETADVTTQFTGPSLHEIFGEIARLQSTPPSEAEVKGIERYMSGLFVIRNSSRGALIAQLSYVDLHGLGNDYLKTYVQNVNAVTPEDVQRMAREYIKPEEMTIVVVGDKAKIGDQLKPFEPAPQGN
jgi:zinc protease